MKEFLSEKKLLLIIICLAAILRLWKLGSIPPHLTQDEAALGYNAYSILRTGRDEYGKILPIIFKSFGDYKPGLYVYLTAPSVALLGLNEFAVRLPSAMAGVVAVWLLYMIVNELVGYGLGVASSKNPTRNTITGNTRTALTAVFLLAINPWHIHFSRGAWEANLSLTLTLVGIYFFLRALRSSKFLVLSSFFFSLTFITYQGAKLSTFIILLVLLVSFWPELRGWLASARRILAGSVILGLIITLPIIFSMFQGKTGRLEIFSVFSYPRPKEYLQEFLNRGGEKIGSFSYYLFHPESLNFKRGILGRWFNHYSGRFLFFEGDWQNPRHSAPNQGMFLLFDLISVTVGLYILAKMGLKKETSFVWLWLLLAPLPAALSRDQVQAVRSLNLAIPLVLVMSLGLKTIFNYINGLSVKWLRGMGYGTMVIGYLVSLIYFLDAYFVHLPIHSAKHWNYGYREVVETVTAIQKDYQNIIIKQSYNQPYIYFLFYQKYDPVKYQKQAKLVESPYGDVGLIEKLDNITFNDFSWPPGVDKGDLVVGDEVSAPKDLIGKDYKVISEIKYPDRYGVAFRILEAL